MLDLLLGRLDCIGFRIETRDEDLESIDGVVGAERPSIYEMWCVVSGRASGSGSGSREVNGARVK